MHYAPAQPRRAHAHGEITPHLTPADGFSLWSRASPNINEPRA